MDEPELRAKIKEYFENKGAMVEEEISFDMKLQEKGIFSRVLRVDLLVTTIGKKQIGIECKTMAASPSMGTIFAGVGQAYLYTKIFGWAYLALEVTEKWLQKNREFWKHSILTNINNELKIGILLVEKNVSEVGKPLFIYPDADTLFVRSMVSEDRCGRCNMIEPNLIDVEDLPYKICEGCNSTRTWHWQPLK